MCVLQLHITISELLEKHAWCFEILREFQRFEFTTNSTLSIWVSALWFALPELLTAVAKHTQDTKIPPKGVALPVVSRFGWEIYKQRGAEKKHDRKLENAAVSAHGLLRLIIQMVKIYISPNKVRHDPYVIVSLLECWTTWAGVLFWAPSTITQSILLQLT